MTKEDKDLRALEKIGKTVDHLEDTLDKLDGKESKLKEWYEQKKAVHEIKKILSETTDYADFNPEEYEAFMVDYNGYMYPGEYNQTIF